MRFIHLTNNLFLHSRPAINRRATIRRPLPGAESWLQPAPCRSPTSSWSGGVRLSTSAMVYQCCVVRFRPCERVTLFLLYSLRTLFGKGNPTYALQLFSILRYTPFSQHQIGDQERHYTSAR